MAALSTPPHRRWQGRHKATLTRISLLTTAAAMIIVFLPVFDRLSPEWRDDLSPDPHRRWIEVLLYLGIFFCLIVKVAIKEVENLTQGIERMVHAPQISAARFLLLANFLGPMVVAACFYTLAVFSFIIWLLTLVIIELLWGLF